MISINGKFYVDNSHNYDYNKAKENSLMSNRLFFAVLSVSSLLLGGILYLLFRENTYISALLKDYTILEEIRDCLGFIENDFIKYYFPDFLWSFSLAFGLLTIFDSGFKGIVICSEVSFVCGLFWEILQFLNVVSGTGDLFDIAMYLTAAVCVVVICSKRRNSK